MGGPADGIYVIQLEPPGVPGFPAGVPQEPDPVVPVVTQGTDFLIQVKKVGDKYLLTVDASNPGKIRNIQADALEVIGSTEAPPLAWDISGSDPGPYVISLFNERVDIRSCWGVVNPGPRQPVVLQNMPPVEGVTPQQWYFIPVNK